MYYKMRSNNSSAHINAHCNNSIAIISCMATISTGESNYSTALVCEMAGVLDLDALRAELVEKDNQLAEKAHKLVLAGLAGKSLLEENQQLRQDLKVLKEDETALQETLRTKHLSEMKLAQQHIGELEVELETYRCRLKEDQAATSSASNDFRIACKQFAEENSLLEQRLEQVTEKYSIEVKQLRLKLEESENMKGILSQDYNQTERSLLELKSENETIEQTLFSMHKSNEQLSSELEDTKEEVDLWEYRCHSQEEELHYQSQELDNSKDLLMQLQQELNQKITPRTAVSQRSSRTSLYDEMFLLEETTEQQTVNEITYNKDVPVPVLVRQDQDIYKVEVDADVTPVAVDGQQNNSTIPNSGFEQYLSLSEDDLFQTLRPKQKKSTGTNTAGGEAETQPCHRCQELEKSEKEKEEEVKKITNLLLQTVKRKIELQEQINAWEADMALVLASNMEQKLNKDKKKWSNQKLKTSKDKAHHRTLSFQFIKNSWLF